MRRWHPRHAIHSMSQKRVHHVLRFPHHTQTNTWLRSFEARIGSGHHGWCPSAGSSGPCLWHLTKAANQISLGQCHWHRHRASLRALERPTWQDLVKDSQQLLATDDPILVAVEAPPQSPREESKRELRLLPWHNKLLYIYMHTCFKINT